MRMLLLLLALPLLATFAPKSLTNYADIPDDPWLWVEPVPLREEGGGGRRIGALTFIEGWSLRSNHPYFGGISAIHVEGRRVFALSDGGITSHFDLPTRPGRMAIRLRDLSGMTGQRKTMRDSEAMAVHGGRFWVAFERENAVIRYARDDWRREASANPPEMRNWPLNSGSEAMVRLRDGRFLILSEGRRLANGATEALLFAGDPAVEGTEAMRLGYRAPEGFRITDAAQLPDGRLLFLNRRISILDGIQVKLTVAEAPELRPGAVLSGRELAHFEPPVTTDNYEALSLAEEDGRTILWIASDDNFMGFQRTLLMKFALSSASR
jgi:hypothetical protein